MTRKTKLAALTAALLGGAALATYAVAQQGHGRMGNGPGMTQGGQGMGHGMGGGMGPGMGGGRMGGMMGGEADPTARLGAVKSRLGIKPDQEAAWTTYAKVFTDVTTERHRVRDGVDRDAVHKMTPTERQAFRDSMWKQRDADWAKIKTAAETLVATLDDTQKAQARRTLPGLTDVGPARGEGQGHGMRQGMMGGPGGGRGHDRH